MAAIRKIPQKVTLVRCGECRHFRRDTEGRSYNAYTHEYFMGVCGLGLTPDSPIKQFADKARVCERFSGANGVNGFNGRK